MFPPALPSTVNVFAATPGWLFIPAPTSDTFPISASVATSPMPSPPLRPSRGSPGLPLPPRPEARHLPHRRVGRDVTDAQLGLQRLERLARVQQVVARNR